MAGGVCKQEWLHQLFKEWLVEFANNVAILAVLLLDLAGFSHC